MSAKKKKKYNSRFPPARVKKIMQSDEEIGKVAAAVPVIISRSLELFVESLIRRAHEITSGRNARTLTPSHIKLCVQSEAKFDFLKDLVVGIQDLQGDIDEQPQTPIVSPRDNPLRSTSNPKEATAKPHTLPRQISTYKPRAVKRSHEVKTKKSESISSNPEGVEQKVGKKRGRKKKEKITKFVDDTEVVEQQVLNGNVHHNVPIGDLPKILNGSSSTSRNDLKQAPPNHLDVKEPSSKLTTPPLFVASPKPSTNLNKNLSAQAAPRPSHIPPCLATATAVAALKPSVARGNGQAMVRRSELVNTMGGVSFSLSYTLPSATPSTPTFTTTNSSCQSLVKQSSDPCVSNFSKIHETASNLMSEKISKTNSWSFAENLDEDYDS